MAMIPLAEYAKRIGKSRNTVYHKYLNGTFKTAQKMGRDIWIDEDEPYTDQRIKSGNYIDWKYGYRYQKQRREEKAAEAAQANLEDEQAQKP